VEYAVSEDSKNYEVVATLTPERSAKKEGPFTESFEANFDARPGRYVRVHARSIGTIPSWHRAAGVEAWLFADEVIVE